jgi:hypothetical protein
LVLRRRGDPFLNGQIRQKRHNFRFTQGTRMLHAMKVNKPLNPADVGCFRAVGVVFAPQCSADLIKQFRWM